MGQLRIFLERTFKRKARKKDITKKLYEEIIQSDKEGDGKIKRKAISFKEISEVLEYAKVFNKNEEKDKEKESDVNSPSLKKEWLGQKLINKKRKRYTFYIFSNTLKTNFR